MSLSVVVVAIRLSDLVLRSSVYKPTVCDDDYDDDDDDDDDDAENLSIQVRTVASNKICKTTESSNQSIINQTTNNHLPSQTFT